MTVLDDRALNRATLARQHLLTRGALSVPEAVAHLCGLQAQEPQEPFVGLWSRVAGFRPGQLDEALTGRAVVRTHLMRRTVHLVTAADALAWRARHDAMLRQRVLGTYRRELADVDLDEVEAAGRAVMADGKPRTMRELVEAVEARRPGRGLGEPLQNHPPGPPHTVRGSGEPLPNHPPGPPRRVLGELLVAALIPMAQLPPRGLWQQTAGVRNLPLAAWLGRDIDPLPVEDGGLVRQAGPAGDGAPTGSDAPTGISSSAQNSSPGGDRDPVGQHLLRRYLAAHGPAATADLRAWCGLAGLPAAVKAVRDELVVFRDERGRELLDLPDAPRPDPGTPAPVRFLPAFDNAILGYHDRSRIIDAAHLGLSVAGHRMVLVDGRVTATWTVRDHRLRVSPLRLLTGTEEEAVRAEAHALAAFLDAGIEDVHLGTGD